MDDDSDDCFMDDNGGLWVYVDDHYDEAEELAEHACPSPPYTQELATEEDYDRYDIWEDLEYMSDGWYDADTEHAVNHDSKDDAKNTKRKSPPLTRKRKAAEQSQLGARKRRGNMRTTEVSALEQDAKDAKPPVLWMSQTERLRSPSVLAASTCESRPVALLRDWRQTCPPQILKKKQTITPADAKDDPSTQNHKQIPEPAHKRSTVQTEGEGLSQESNEVPDEEADSEGKTFDLDLQSVASMLSEDQLNALRGQLQEKGLDPSALETVLKDMMEGREPEFDDEAVDEEGDEEDQDPDIGEEVEEDE